MRRLVGITIFLNVLLPTSAHAGVVVELKVKSKVLGNQPMHFEQYLDGTSTRVDLVGKGGKVPFALFQGPKKTLNVIDHDRKEYLEISEGDIRQLNEQMVKMKEMMKSLPPDAQRQIASQMPAERSEKRSYRKLGTKKVGSWTCTRFQATAGGRKVGELCVVPMEKVKVKRADLKALDVLKDLYKDSPMGTTQQFAQWGYDFSQGFPVESMEYGPDGGVVFESRVVRVARENRDAKAFMLPAGFKRKPMPVFQPGTRPVAPPPPRPQ